MLRKYLQLARLPNAFTAPSNVVTGYLIVTPVANLNFISLGTLMLSSALLYVSGIIFNDYFDFEIDKKERPFRPLPSGSISKQRAVEIAIVLMVLSNIISLLVSLQSLVIAIFLSCIILAYDSKLKHSKFFGPITMGSTRFLNVIFGASSIIQLSIHPYFLQLIFASVSMFTFVVIIALFSRKEVSGLQSRIEATIQFSFIYSIIVSIVIATLLGYFKISCFVILVPFGLVMSIIFRKMLSGGSMAIQTGIKNMVISIIVLDSIFISGTAGLQYGLLTLLLLPPTVILSRKLYVT